MTTLKITNIHKIIAQRLFKDLYILHDVDINQLEYRFHVVPRIQNSPNWDTYDLILGRQQTTKGNYPMRWERKGHILSVMNTPPEELALDKLIKIIETQIEFFVADNLANKILSGSYTP